MNLIVFDVIVNSRHQVGSKHKTSIIGIGAIKASTFKGKLVIIDSFQRELIEPNEDKSITGLFSLEQATGDFLEWIGEQDYYLFSWADNILHTLFLNRTYEDYPMRWIKNYNSVQKSLIKNLSIIESEAGLKEILLQKGMRVNLKEIMGKLESVTELIIENIDKVDLEKNTLEDLMTGFTSPTYRTCKHCNKEKWCGDYGIKSKKLRHVCKSCFIDWMNTKRGI